MSTAQDRPPNFREEGRLYLVRCFACGTSDRGTENWAMAVASGECAWCGWSEDTGKPLRGTATPESTDGE